MGGLEDEEFSVFLQVLISQSLQPTFIDELTSQPGTLYYSLTAASIFLPGGPSEKYGGREVLLMVYAKLLSPEGQFLAAQVSK